MLYLIASLVVLFFASPFLYRTEKIRCEFCNGTGLCQVCMTLFRTKGPGCLMCEDGYCLTCKGEGTVELPDFDEDMER